MGDDLFCDPPGVSTKLLWIKTDSPTITLWGFAGSLGRSTSVAYLARFKRSRAVPDPSDVVGVLQLSSSPDIVKERFCSVPFQFGNEQPSMWMVAVFALSSTEYVPK